MSKPAGPEDVGRKDAFEPRDLVVTSEADHAPLRTGGVLLIASSAVFELLGEMLWSEDMSQDEDYRQFAFGMLLAPSGVSLDPSFSAAFESGAPDSFATKAAAIEYSARFLASELVGFWGFTDGQAIVDQLESLAQGVGEGLSLAVKQFNDALTALSEKAGS